MRGEDPRGTSCTGRLVGSPPHARGRRYSRYEPRSRARITPACAGKTRPQAPPRSTRRDHPRMRGEDQLGIAKNEIAEGSPPHARGRPSFGGMSRFCTGITPACAGKTSMSDAPVKISGDHPRMRGEDLKPAGQMIIEGGSPPHARGRLGMMFLAGVVRGITPACAGKTRRQTR